MVMLVWLTVAFLQSVLLHLLFLICSLGGSTTHTGTHEYAIHISAVASHYSIDLQELCKEMQQHASKPANMNVNNSYCQFKWKTCFVYVFQIQKYFFAVLAEVIDTGDGDVVVHRQSFFLILVSTDKWDVTKYPFSLFLIHHWTPRHGPTTNHRILNDRRIINDWRNR